MPKEKTFFECIECGNESPRWMGRCPGCGQWNTMVETSKKAYKADMNPDRLKPMVISEIAEDSSSHFTSGSIEFDRVLGGGIVPGAVILIGGDPGIGKSTLLLQVANWTALMGKRVFYVSGEESAKQIKMRAQRLGMKKDSLYIITETDMEAILETLNEYKPDLVIIDSIQTMNLRGIPSAAGSIIQVREVTSRITEIAKDKEIAFFLVGHVTKQGAIAGPRVLEHMVDTVLYFEGERHQPFRVIRCVKNRFGSTNEVGIFDMVEGGLKEVKNPSEVFLQGRPMDTTGSVVIASIEGTRPVLFELQALVTPAPYGNPRRMATGVDTSRVALIMAVLEKKLGYGLSSFDSYINIIGGIKIDEPALDLGLAMAIISSFKEKPIDPRIVLVGEIGLTGEIRRVNNIEKRVIEAEKLGFMGIVIPEENLKEITRVSGIEIVGASNIKDVIESLF